MYVSCASFDIYRDGGLQDDPAQLQALRATPLRADSIEIFPPYSYYRPAFAFACESESFAQALVADCQEINQTRDIGAASVLVILPRALIGRDLLHVVTDEATAPLYETHRPNERPFARMQTPDELAGARSRLDADEAVQHLFLGGIGSGNLQHWLVDDLPRLAAVSTLQAEAPERRLVVLITASGDAAIDEMKRQSVQAALSAPPVPHEVRFLDPEILYEVDRLAYVSPVSYHPVLKSPHALEHVRSSIGRQLGRTRTAVGIKLYVPPGEDGPIGNADEIEALMRANGFEVLDVAGSSFTDAAALFRDADLVVGPMSGIMSNTVFCRSKTTLLYLASEGRRDPFYWDLAASLGQSYAVCYGADGGEGQFRIDLDTLTQALQRPG